MVDYRVYVGFSLVEILVSLFVVSLAAVNITGLQKMVAQQNRDNISHLIVIDLVSGKFEEVMQFDSLNDVVNLNGVSSSFNDQGTDFDLKWEVKTVEGTPVTSSVREVSMLVTWKNSTGDIQKFRHSQQILVSAQFDGKDSDKNFPYTISNLLGTNRVNYFDSEINYKNDAYVIYDSQLFQATGIHSTGNGDEEYIESPVNNAGEISDAWQKLGAVDDEKLTHLFAD